MPQTAGKVSVMELPKLFGVLILVTFSLLGNVYCDSPPPDYTLKHLDIQGAKIVSEGAYFRIWIRNRLDFPIKVKIVSDFMQTDWQTIPTNESASFPLVAPLIESRKETVTYTIMVLYGTPGREILEQIQFPVTVIKESALQISDGLLICFILYVCLSLTVIIYLIKKQYGIGKKGE